MSDIDINALLNAPRPVSPALAAIVGVKPPHSYRVYVTGHGTAAGLHQRVEVDAQSVGEAVDEAFMLLGVDERDGSQYTFTVERLTEATA